MYHVLLVHSSIDEHLGSSSVLTTVNNAAVNMNVQLTPRDCAFNSECISSSGATESYDNSIFNLLRNQHSVFQGNNTFPLIV